MKMKLNEVLDKLVEKLELSMKDHFNSDREFKANEHVIYGNGVLVFELEARGTFATIYVKYLDKDLDEVYYSTFHAASIEKGIESDVYTCIELFKTYNKNLEDIYEEIETLKEKFKADLIEESRRLIPAEEV